MLRFLRYPVYGESAAAFKPLLERGGGAERLQQVLALLMPLTSPTSIPIPTLTLTLTLTPTLTLTLTLALTLSPTLTLGARGGHAASPEERPL